MGKWDERETECITNALKQFSPGKKEENIEGYKGQQTAEPLERIFEINVLLNTNKFENPPLILLFSLCFCQSSSQRSNFTCAPLRIKIIKLSPNRTATLGDI